MDPFHREFFFASSVVGWCTGCVHFDSSRPLLVGVLGHIGAIEFADKVRPGQRPGADWQTGGPADIAGHCLSLASGGVEHSASTNLKEVPVICSNFTQQAII